MPGAISLMDLFKMIKKKKRFVYANLSLVTNIFSNKQ